MAAPSYIKQVISGDDNGATYHRFLGVIAGITLCTAVLFLTIAIALGREEATAALLSVSGPLATMATFAYRDAKKAETATTPPADDTPAS